MRTLDPRRLELRWQLSLAMVLVLSATLLVAVGVVLRNARSAVADELRASLSATADSLDATLLLLDRLRPDEAASALDDWIAAQSGSRHLCAVLRAGAVTEPADTVCPRDVRSALTAPAWFARGVVDGPRRQQRELSIDGRPYTVLLVADPARELNEAWDETRGLLQLIVLMAFTANALIVLLVTLALRPLDAAAAALARMHDGDFDLRMPATAAPDLRRLVQGVDRLSQRLARSADENRRLLLKNLDVQEEERRLMARELHDEIGQHVAAIEMATVGLDGVGGAAVESGLMRVHESVAEIHRLSRRMIRRLRPAALDTLGLAGGLQVLIAQWRSSQPALSLIDEIDPQCDRIDGYTATHVYRIVQEALSNAVRHARASGIQVQLTVTGGEIHLRVADDGCGFDPDGATAGLGLMGVRERVKALGGQLVLTSAHDAGCRLQVRLPATMPRRLRKRAVAANAAPELARVDAV